MTKLETENYEHPTRLNEAQEWKKEITDTATKLIAIHVGVTLHADELEKYMQEIQGQDLPAQKCKSNLAPSGTYPYSGFEYDKADQLTLKTRQEILHSEELKHQHLKEKHKEIIVLLENLYKLIQ